MQEWVRREEVRGLPGLSEGVHGVDAEGRHLQQVPVRGGHGDAGQTPTGVQSSWTEKPAGCYLQVNLRNILSFNSHNSTVRFGAGLRFYLLTPPALNISRKTSACKMFPSALVLHNSIITAQLGPCLPGN